MLYCKEKINPDIRSVNVIYQMAKEEQVMTDTNNKQPKKKKGDILLTLALIVAIAGADHCHLCILFCCI